MRSKDPKIKVGTVLDRAVYQRLKERAVREGRSISELLGLAIERFTLQAGDQADRQRAFDAMMSHAIKVPAAELKAVLATDPFER